MPNYQEGKIYKIYNTINDDIYIGSTTQKLCERMRQHRNDHKSKSSFNYPIYKAFREHGVENFFIELIEKCPCNDKDELRRTEGEYIRSLKPSMNKAIAGRTTKEYYNDNKEHILQNNKAIYLNNKTNILEKHKTWREENKEAIQQYYEENKERILNHNKQYRKNNKEYISQKEKEYREHNKDFIKAYSGEKITCECGCIVTRGHLARHKRSVKHQQLMI